jgi:hypothetical protein
MDCTNPNQTLQGSHANIYNELRTPNNTKEGKVGDHYVHACICAV